MVRAQLGESFLRLHKILDPQWKEYLALPGEVYVVGKAPAKDVLAKCLDRYSSVTKEARYQELSARAEFQDTYALLHRFRSALEGSKSDTLKLPPPPCLTVRFAAPGSWSSASSPDDWGSSIGRCDARSAATSIRMRSN